MSTAARERLRALHGLELPDDFFSFHDFVQRLGAETVATELQVSLGGSFAVFDDDAWRARTGPAERYYNDPPEFVTVLYGLADGEHWGYYYDAPGELRPVVASFFASDGLDIGVEGDDLFEAMRRRIELFHRDCAADLEAGVDTEGAAAGLEGIAAARSLLKTYATAGREQQGDHYDEAYPGGLSRRPLVVAPTSDGMGLVVPPERYRPRAHPGVFGARSADASREAVKRLVDEALADLKEGYPGGALHLGKNLWCWPAHRQACCALLDAAYQALGRPLLGRWLAEASAFRAVCDAARPARAGA